MVMRLSAVSRSGRRVSPATLLILVASAGLLVWRLAPARLSSPAASANQEADHGAFLTTTAVRGGGTMRNDANCAAAGQLTMASGASGAYTLASAIGAGLAAGAQGEGRRSPTVARRADADFKVGDSVTGEIIDVRPNMLFVKVKGHSKQATSLLSLLEKDSITEYRVGQAFEGKVHKVNTLKGNLVLTQLDEPRMDPIPKVERERFEIRDISNMLNEEMEGTVMATRPSVGIFIDVGIKGRNAFAPMRFCPRGTTKKDFTPGQKVQCWVVNTNEAKGQVTVSLVAPPEGGFQERSLKTQMNKPKMDAIPKVERERFEITAISNMLNEEMEGTVMMAHRSGILIDVGINGSDAFVPWSYFPKRKSLKDFTLGQKVRCWVVSTNEAKRQVTVSLLPPPEGGFQEQSFKTQMDEPKMDAIPKVKRRMEIRDISSMLNEKMEGTVMAASSVGIFIDVGIKGRNAFVPRRFCPRGKTKKDFTPGQKVLCWVVSTNEAKRQVTVSLLPPPEGGFQERSFKTQADEPQMDATPKVERMMERFEIRDISNMLNEEIEGTVMTAHSFGIFIDVGIKGGTGAFAPRRFFPKGKSPKDFTPGQKVRCWVASTDEAKRQVKVSLVTPPEGGFQERSFKTQEVKRMRERFQIWELSSMLNEEMKGIVMTASSFGIFIDVGIKGKDAFVPWSHVPKCKSLNDFTPGQKVRCWVVSANEAKRQVRVSLVAPPEGGFQERSSKAKRERKG